MTKDDFALREKRPYSELFWSAFSRIQTEYGEIFRISPYSVRMRENADQNNSKYGHFLLLRICPYSVKMRENAGQSNSEYGHFLLLRICPYSVQMRENADQNKSEYGHFLRSVVHGNYINYSEHCLIILLTLILFL